MYEGVKQRVIVDELAVEGFEVSLRDFRVLLSRARKVPKPSIQIEANVIKNELKIESDKPVEKITKKQQDQPKLNSSKKMSQQEITDMLNKPLDLDSL
jgi:hypothetical protein